ncbi:hypothetical protein DBW_2019 [Desulfuromonas sp. DDH964]|uniref:hypothetical protein n=1 Tax=Desulfuromonas sp. DDH964 TaxID=1823759 RepID=UPI00078E8131|nr:hypothetical protein [Desulfuromonas sp. DDH964]AMV72363.1 hypothetical protein DBW_2019 [Desulfuromonas sp. DDH964]
MAVTDKERKLAATLSDPVLWGQAYLYNRDGSGRDYWPHQVEDLRCPAKNIIHLDGRDVGDPGIITVLKGNKPLCLRIHRQHRVVLYASDDAFIDFAVDNEKGWRVLEVPPMTMLTIRHKDVRAIENSEFRFIIQERKGTS